MILDVENNENQLVISFFDEEGKIKIKQFDLETCYNWKICSDSDYKKSTEYKNWDGKSVKRIPSSRFNKYSIYEFIDSLPKEDKDQITALNFPKVQSIDIETEVIDNFPVPEIARERITAIAIATESNATVVLGWKPLTKEQEKIIYDKHREYLKEYGDWQFKYICFEDEYNMMYTFINKFVPNFSMMIGWNFLNFDWKYNIPSVARFQFQIDLDKLGDESGDMSEYPCFYIDLSSGKIPDVPAEISCGDGYRYANSASWLIVSDGWWIGYS